MLAKQVAGRSAGGRTGSGKLIHVYYGKILLRSVAFEPGQRYHGQGRVRKEVAFAR